VNWCLDRYDVCWVRCMDDSCRLSDQLLLIPMEPSWGEGVRADTKGVDPYDTVRTDPSEKPASDFEDGLPF